MKPFSVIILILSVSIGHCQTPADTADTWHSKMEGCLQRIQAGDDEDVGFSVYDIALTWAAAGFIQQTNELLTRYWDYQPKNLDEYRNLNNGFRILWALSGKQPAHPPFSLRPVDEIEQDNWDRLFNMIPGLQPDYPDSVRTRPWQDLSGLALEEKATLLSCDIRMPDHRADRASRKEAILAFSRYFATEKPVGYSLYYGSNAAALVAAGLGDDVHTREFIRDWGLGYLQYSQNFSLESLMEDTASARYLLSGILAPVWGITDSSCSADLTAVEDVLSKRMKNGPTLVFGQLTLQELLKRLSAAATPNSQWLGYPPATDAAIKAVEKRLGAAIPEDYKSFLRATNGFRPTSSVSPSFLPIDSIGWLRDLDSELVKLWGEPMSDKDSIRATEFRRAILIGGFQEEQSFLIVPPAGTDKDWKYWFFASWTPGITVYPSLRFYLEYELRFLLSETNQRIR